MGQSLMNIKHLGVSMLLQELLLLCCELYLYCQANNINFLELRDALNTKWNIQILEPREGIGGHCLQKMVCHACFVRHMICIVPQRG